MDSQPIESCIQALEAQAPIENAAFTLTHDPETAGSFVVKANREGLQRYAVELLKASLTTDKVYGLPHPDEHSWLAWQGDAELSYVEVVEGKPVHIDRDTSPKINHSRRMGVLFYGLIAVVAFFMIIGIIETFRWLFG